MPLLTTIPGVAWVLGYTIASEIGEIGRFASPAKLAGYTGLCPRVEQSGERDRRGPLTKHGPRYLRWALIEAAQHAARHPAYHDLLGPQEGPAPRHARQQDRRHRRRPQAQRGDLAHAHPQTPFAPAGATLDLAA